MTVMFHPKRFPRSAEPLIGPRPIGGAMFGAPGGEGGEEAPNTLKSRQTARVVDLLGEGPIVGPWNGLESIYYDGVPLQRKNRPGYNFSNFTITGVSGYPNQPTLKGFKVQESEIGVGVQLKKNQPITRRISAAETDRVRITVSVPALMKTMDNGNIKGTTVQFRVRMQANNGGYQTVTTNVIDGKTNTQYQRQLVFQLKGQAPWDIQLERLTDNSNDLKLQNDLYWDAYTEIIDAKINYRLSSVIGHTVRAEDFDNIPTRAYDCGGLLVRYPSNYDPHTHTYSGTWDGTFLTGWCNNPAWVFYDLVVEGRYGIGNFISEADVDKWELYTIARWCDGRVDDGSGTGSTEPRWVFNGAITEQYEAYDLLANIASVWRGSAFWAGGSLVTICDMPADPVFQFTNANVVEGRFSYQGADRRARHNQIAVAWNDPANLGERRLAIVEDQDAIAKNGVQKTDAVAMGCTRESQAIRVGKWMLYTENYESETVAFLAGMEGAYVRPGHVIQISDVAVTGKRVNGRIKAVTSGTITLDAPVTLTSGAAYFLSYVKPDGTVVTIGVTAAPNTPVSTLNLTAGWSGGVQPLIDSIWVLSTASLEPTLWHVISAKPNGADRYDINAVTHNPSKWSYIEKGFELENPDISDIGGDFEISNLTISEYLYQMSPIAVGTKMLISWQSTAPYFDVAYREINGPWVRLSAITQQTVEVDVLESAYEIWVTPVNGLGLRGDTTKVDYTVSGKSDAPSTPTNFRVQQVTGVAMFQWATAPELDVLVGGSYEMRYSPRTLDATWSSSNTVIRSIPGTATTVELPYRPGTYLLKAKDVSGLMSFDAAMIVITGSDSMFTQFVRICEQPAWAGTHSDTTIRMPQEWLILADGKTSGIYTFANQLDIGGIFSIRLTVDMLAFPYIPGVSFIDERTGLVDEWSNWDDPGGDGQGMVTVRMRQTNDDPTSGSANWSAWTQFIGGDYTARGFQFQAWLTAPPGQNIAVEELCIIADVSNKNDSGADIVWVPTKMHIPYVVKFFTVPAISVVVQNAVTGDTIRITNKTKTGFDLELLNSAGAVITGSRTFDWIAQGY